MTELTPICLTLALVSNLLAGLPAEAQSKPFSVSGDVGGGDGPQILTGRIRGRVISAQTGESLRGARVTITGAQPIQTTTDHNGRYDLTDIPAGQIALVASRAGYLSSRYGQRAHGSGDIAIALAAGQTLNGIDFALDKAGVIAVHVVDEHGDPVMAARVQVSRYQYMPDGKRRPVKADAVGPTVTDDLGNVRIAGLAAGAYMLSAVAQDSGMFEGNAADGFGPTYFPGVASVPLAQPIHVGVGEEVSARMALTRVPLSRVSGIVRTSDGGVAVGATVRLKTTAGDSYSLSARTDHNGSFVIPKVAPGEYVVETRTMRRADGVAGEFARTAVSATAISSPLDIVTQQGAVLSGRVVGHAARPTLDRALVRVVAEPADSEMESAGLRTGNDGLVAADGTFRIAGAIGRLFFGLVGPPNLAITTVMLNGHDITDQPLDLFGRVSVPDIEITITAAGSVAGQVIDARGAVLTDYAVVLVPVASSGDYARRRTRVASPSADGRFQIDRLPAGQYNALAVRALEAGGEFAPEFQERVRTGGVVLTLTAGQTRSVVIAIADNP